MTELTIWPQADFVSHQVSPGWPCVSLLQSHTKEYMDWDFGKAEPKRGHNCPLLLYIRELSTAEERIMLAMSMQGKWL